MTDQLSEASLKAILAAELFHAMHVVFFRAVNVGGHQKFQPSALAKELREFGVVNFGAAGTFVVRETIAPAKLQTEILCRLTFKPELMICPARDVLSLAQSEPFANASIGKDVQRFVSIMPKTLSKTPKFPIEKPAGRDWEIRIIGIVGQFVLSLRRVKLGGKFYPNAVVEKEFGVSATTRNWNTIAAICKILDA